MYQGDMLSWTDFPGGGSYPLGGYIKSMTYSRASDKFGLDGFYGSVVTAYDLAQG